MRHRAQKSITGPERRKERETFCVRFGKWTRFLRWRTQLHKTTRIVSRFSIYTALLDVLKSRVMKRTSISYCAMRDFAISAMANSTTQNDSQCESFFNLYRLIRCERDECGYSGKQNFTVRSFGPVSLFFKHKMRRHLCLRI